MTQYDYAFIDYSWSSLVYDLHPDMQKGKKGKLTCVGIIERAAEKSGYDGGEGFLKDEEERISIRFLADLLPPITLPLLSPEAIYRKLKPMKRLPRIKNIAGDSIHDDF